MCCFSGPVQSVTSTRIFSRLTGDGGQFIAYQMKFRSKDPNAMILPLPTVAGGGDDSVRFVDLSGYDRFFADLNRGFLSPPAPKSPPLSRSPTEGIREPQLEVHRVGSFDASFVPTMGDFDRLDPRFVISKQVWAKLPQYKDWGFAVFQLHDLSGEPHPMAFEFRTRLPDTVFFPTVHIHDGTVHPTEDFHHTLYAQHAALDEIVGEPSWRPDPITQMVRSTKLAGQFVKIDKTKGLVDSNLLVHRRKMRGRHPNQDVWISARGGATKQKFGFVKTFLPLGVFLPLTWIVRRRDELQRK